MHESTPGSSAAHLKRDIGFFGASFLVLNAVIGAGIFALPGKIAVNAGLFSPWLFVICGLLAIVLAWATVGWQVLKVARRNPVHALHYE